MNEYLRLSLELNDGIIRTGADILKCAHWLAEFGASNDMTINELSNMCWEDSNWVFDQVF